jgi:lipopolysaccharide/colanic/teichoic acid biosynthesis glycosyltransferase
MYRAIKRILDILISLIALPFFLIIWIFAAIFIKAEDGGPVFYKAARIGKDGKKIFMYKFRSMKVNAPDIRNEDGSTYNAKDDPRVTKIGKFLRETSLDETAQILNVLKGDMSIIGPRASNWDALESYLPDEMDKLKVRPGITGYVQAYYRNNATPHEKRIHDGWYANNLSLLLDIKIVFKTIAVVIKRENLYTASDTSNESKEAEEVRETIKK